LKVDEFAERIAAACEPAGVAQARRIIVGPGEDGLQESLRMRHGGSLPSQS
jgi:hypothetical protein